MGALGRVTGRGAKLPSRASQPLATITLRPNQSRQLLKLAEGAERIQSLDFSTGRCFEWARFDFGKEYMPEQPKEAVPAQVRALNHDNDSLSRGYVQVNFQQIPKAVRIIIEVAKKREARGEPTSFKFLLAALSHERSTREAGAETLPASLVGIYDKPDPADPVIAIWAQSENERDDILRELVQNPGWKKLEDRKQGDTIRHGSVHFINPYTRKPSRILCFNEHRGHAIDRRGM